MLFDAGMAGRLNNMHGETFSPPHYIEIRIKKLEG